MARSKRYIMSDTSGGICQYEELARPNQFQNAKNVWAPNGNAETRPGLVYDDFTPQGFSAVSSNKNSIGVGGVNSTWAGPAPGSAGQPITVPGLGNLTCQLYTDTSTPAVSVADTAAGNFLANFPFGYLYFRFNFPTYITARNLQVFSSNNTGAHTSGTVSSTYQYWNGTTWANQVGPTTDLPLWQRGNGSLTFDYWLRVAITQPWLGAFGVDVFSNWNGNFVNSPSISVTYYPFSLAGIEQAVYRNGTNYLYVGNGDNTPQVAVVGNASAGNLPITADMNRDCEPPSVAVLPEFNTAFLAYDGTVYECPLNSVPSVADIERRAELVYKINGEKMPYYDGRDGDVVSGPGAVGFVPQLTAFPQANYVLYHQGQLFTAYRDTLRWSAPASDGAYKVFPIYAFETASNKEDDSAITGLAAFQENVVIFKRRSIWLATFSGLNLLDLPMYSLQRVVSGVGCVAHDTIDYLGDGRLVFGAEDGVYAFNGATVEKLSRDIDQAYSEISPNFMYKMTGCTWRTKNYYLVAAPIAGAQAQGTTLSQPGSVCTRIFAYDYKRNGWWFWDFDEIITLNTALVADAIEKVVTGRRLGFLARFQGVQSLNGNPIPVELETWRIGDDGIVKEFREVRVNADQVVNSVSVSVRVGDELTDNTQTMDFTSSMEAKYGTAVYGTDLYRPIMRRERRLDIRRTGRWVTLKLNTSVAAVTQIWNITTAAVLQGLR